MTFIKRFLFFPLSFHRWLFSRGSPESIAALRIVFGLIVFSVMLIQLPLLADYYGEKGLVPAEALRLWQWRGWTFNPLPGLPFGVVIGAYFLLLAASLSMAFGFYSRLSTWIVFIGLLSFHHRNPLILNSGDTLLRMVIFYLALARSGAAFSVDSYLKSRAAAGLEKRADSISLFPQRLIQIQLAIVYFSAVWHKAQGQLWREGTSTWYVSRLEELRRFPLPEFMMTEWAALLSTYGTMAIQLSLCTLVWFRPYRNWVLLAGLLMHLSMEYQFNIPFFSLITLGCYISFFKGSEIRSFLGRFAITRRSSAENPEMQSSSTLIQ